MGYKREGTRMVVERGAEIQSISSVVACTVVNLSEGGFRIRGGSKVAQGETLQFECSLPRDRRIQCLLQVMHTTASGFGAKIAVMTPEHRRQLSEFIEDLIAMNCPRA